jgi:hypothetical protein
MITEILASLNTLKVYLFKLRGFSTSVVFLS